MFSGQLTTPDTFSYHTGRAVPRRCCFVFSVYILNASKILSTIGLSILMTVTLALVHLKEDRQPEVLLQSMPRRAEAARQSSYQTTWHASRIDACRMSVLIRPTGLICNSRRSSINPTKISFLHNRLTAVDIKTFSSRCKCTN